jgi:hypothetical protein
MNIEHEQPADLLDEDLVREVDIPEGTPRTTGTIDDDDDPSDEREDENEAPVHESSDATEAPEEFEVDDEDEA